MAEIKWIKMATGLPGNRKIKQIRRLPDGDKIALMWVFMLCLAGDVNEQGLIYLTPEVPYTDEMLADEFDMDITVIRLGLEAFQRFGMIEIVDDIICLSSWEKWQAVDSLATIREQTRKRVAKHREKQKLIASNVTSNVTVTQCNATEEDKEEDKDKDKDKELDNIILSDSDEPEPPAPIKKSKPVKHKYGEYNNVLLTDEELKKLKTEYSDYEERIERLSSYVASTGKSYKSHYATIRNWARKDAEKQPIRKEIVPSWMQKKPGFNDYKQNTYDFEELEKDILENNPDFEERKKELSERLKRKYGKKDNNG